jgi:hypothetical protein
MAWHGLGGCYGVEATGWCGVGNAGVEWCEYVR